jgi:hypothetical protein
LRRRRNALAALALAGATSSSQAGDRPFLEGERVTLKITYLRFLAGRATVSVLPGEVEDGGPRLRFVAEAKSQGFFAWLFRYRVDDRTVAQWDSESGCSLGIEKHLRERNVVRDQIVRIDPVTGVAHVEDSKIRQTRFELDPCVLDILSAFFVTRLRGVSENAPLELPVFDNGKHYRLGVRVRGRERLDLPAPFGKKAPTVIVEPQLLEGTGLFVKEGRLRIWLSDDTRRVPVRMRAKVPIGSVSAELERYEEGHAEMQTAPAMATP